MAMERNNRDDDRTNDPDRNPDPITKAPGSHPVGTGIGAAAGGVAAGIGGAAAAGAAAGSAAGPIGAVAGAAIGAVAGGLIGKGVAESVNPTAEHEYWRQHYSSRPYARPGSTYDEYGPAYEYGWQSRTRYADRNFEDVEDDLRRDWESQHGSSGMTWDRARNAVRDAWDRITSRNQT